MENIVFMLMVFGLGMTMLLLSRPISRFESKVFGAFKTKPPEASEKIVETIPTKDGNGNWLFPTTLYECLQFVKTHRRFHGNELTQELEALSHQALQIKHNNDTEEAKERVAQKAVRAKAFLEQYIKEENNHD